MKKIVLALMLCGYGLNMTQLFCALSDDDGYSSFDESNNFLLMPATPENDEKNDDILPIIDASNRRVSQKRIAREEDRAEFLSSDDSGSESGISDTETQFIKRQRGATSSGASLEIFDVELPQQEISKKLQNALNVAFYRAAESNNIVCMQGLLKLGANINYVINIFDYRKAFIHNLEERVEYCAPLHIAAKNGNLAAVKFLLDHGADIDLVKKIDNTALYFAANNGHDKVVEILLARGADVNGKGCDEVTPLYAAVGNGHEKIVAQLLAAGAEEHGEPYLIIAASNGYVGLVDIFLQHGSDVNMVDDGRNALEYALSEEDPEFTQCAKLLIACGATTEKSEYKEKFNQLNNEINLQQRAFIRMPSTKREIFKVQRPVEYTNYMRFFGLADR